MEKESANNFIEQESARLRIISNAIHSRPELAYNVNALFSFHYFITSAAHSLHVLAIITSFQEVFAHDILTEYLVEKEFEVSAHYLLPTGFKAEYINLGGGGNIT